MCSQASSAVAAQVLSQTCQTSSGYSKPDVHCTSCLQDRVALPAVCLLLVCHRVLGRRRMRLASCTAFSFLSLQETSSPFSSFRKVHMLSATDWSTVTHR